jgi:hypothetical protein
VGAGHDHNADAGVGEPHKLGVEHGEGFLGWGVGVEEVAGDEEKVALAVEGEVHSAMEGGREVAAKLLAAAAELLKTFSQVEVGGMD